MLLGLVVWAIAIGIPEYVGGNTTGDALFSCIATVLILGGGVGWTRKYRRWSRTLLLIIFPLYIGIISVFYVGAESNGSDPGWGAVSVAFAFAIYMASAAWRTSQAPSLVQTDTRQLERFELGSKPPDEFHRQRAFIGVGVAAAWVIAVPVALIASPGTVETDWGPLAVEARVFVHTVAILLAGVVLLVFVGPATRRRPPPRQPIRTRLIRSSLFAMAALLALLTLWLR